MRNHRCELPGAGPVRLVGPPVLNGYGKCRQSPATYRVATLRTGAFLPVHRRFFSAPNNRTPVSEMPASRRESLVRLPFSAMPLLVMVSQGLNELDRASPGPPGKIRRCSATSCPLFERSVLKIPVSAVRFRPCTNTEQKASAMCWGFLLSGVLNPLPPQSSGAAGQSPPRSLLTSIPPHFACRVSRVIPAEAQGIRAILRHGSRFFDLRIRAVSLLSESLEDAWAQ